MNIINDVLSVICGVPYEFLLAYVKASHSKKTKISIKKVIKMDPVKRTGEKRDL